MTHMFAMMLGDATPVAQGGPDVDFRTRWTLGPLSCAAPLDLDDLQSCMGALALVGCAF